MSRYISIILIVDIVDRFHREKKTTERKKGGRKETVCYMCISTYCTIH